MIIIFRGKAATGKTMISNELSKRKSIPILRKDDIFDILLRNAIDVSAANTATYDIMADIIQSHIETKSDLIVDIALSHTPFFEIFLSKFKIADSQVKYYLCDCSDDEIWKSRIKDRFVNPKPNQFFKSTDEAARHYEKHDITPLIMEVRIDSIRPLGRIIEEIMNDL